MQALADAGVVDAVVPASVPVLTKNAVRVLENRYLIRDAGGLKETPAQLFTRVANAVAMAEDDVSRAVWADRFYELMCSGRFMPNSPTLMNAGRGNANTLAACYVLPVPDHTPGIFDSVKTTAIVQKAGGGVGYAFDALRPCGALVSTSGGLSSGPISFWRVFCETTNAIQQGCVSGGTLLYAAHPDTGVLGLYPIRDLVGEDRQIFSFSADAACFLTPTSPITPRASIMQTGAGVEVYRLKTSSGIELVATPEHLVRLYDGSDKAMVDLVSGDRLASFDSRVIVGQRAASAPEYVVSVEPAGTDDVYDATVPGADYFVVFKPSEDGDGLFGIAIHNSFRRGANMGMMRMDHPDIIKFLFAKQDLGQFTNYNISVKVTDAWMRAVREAPDTPHVVTWENRSWLLPRSLVDTCRKAVQGGLDRTGSVRDLDTCYKLSDLIEMPSVSEVRDVLSVGDVMQMIVQHAWQTGEPGLAFVDRIRETEPTPHIGLIEASNPCVTGETLVAVADGRGCVPIADLAADGADVPVYCADSATGQAHVRWGRNPRMTRQQVPIVKVKLDDGSFIRTTPNHKFLRCDGVKVEAKDLQLGDSLMPFGSSAEIELHSPKVTSVEEDGVDDVYNITVDDFHTVAYVTNTNARMRTPGNLMHTGVVTANCGEQYLLANECCNLGSIDLSKYVTPFWLAHSDVTPSTFDACVTNAWRETAVDWAKLVSDVQACVRFLDDVVEIGPQPTPEIAAICKANRKIGLGVMGFADALIRLGVQYDAADGFAWGERFMKSVNDAAIRASQELALEKGSFANFPGSRWDRNGSPGMRNADVTTVAPTGTISIIANCSGGMEPLFSPVFMRQVLGGQRLPEYNDNFKALATIWNFMSSDLDEYIFANGSLQNRDDVPDAAKRLFRTARDINVRAHIAMQAAFQRHVSNSTSKTINMRADASVADVRAAYLFAHELRCKGVTVYRDGCRAEQPMALKSSVKDNAEDSASREAIFATPMTIPDLLPSIRTKYASTYGTLHIHVSLCPTSDGRYRELEVFFQLGRSGDGVHEIMDVYARLASMLLRMGSRMEMVVEQLCGHASRAEKLNGHTGGMTSLPNELAMGLVSYLEAVSGVRDREGLLTAVPGSPCVAKTNAVTRYRSEIASNGHQKSADTKTFVERVRRSSAAAGTLRSPCPTPGCTGELIWSEGCRMCFTCMKSSCG